VARAGQRDAAIAAGSSFLRRIRIIRSALRWKRFSPSKAAPRTPMAGASRMNWRPIDSRKLGQAASVRAQTFMAERGLPGRPEHLPLVL